MEINEYWEMVEETKGERDKCKKCQELLKRKKENKEGLILCDYCWHYYGDDGECHHLK